MKLRFRDADSDGDDDSAGQSSHRAAATHSQRAVHSDGASLKPPTRCNRFRAPSLNESATESSDDDDDEDSETLALGSALSSLHVALLNSKSRQELLRHVERTCEIKAVHAVNSSRAYQLLCETLQRARADAEARLKRVDATQHDDAAFQALLRKNIELTSQSARALSQRRGRDRSVLQAVEQELIAFQRALAEESKAQAEARAREDAARQREEDARAKAQQDAKDRAAALEAKEAAARAAETRRQADAAQAKADAEAKQQALKAEQEEAARAAKQAALAKRQAEAAAKQFVVDAKARVARLDAIHELSQQILANPDPAIKKIRVDIKLQAGACNQISAAPSAIKNVVDKIHALLQTAKASGENYFRYAMDLVATNLAKQARVVLDYKSCYPVAHVITMSCVRTPELTDIVLAYFHKLCVFTIPESPTKTASQSVGDYKRALGFEPAIGETSDPHGLEHITVYTKRMTMVVAVLAAVMQTAPYDSSPQPAGLSIGDCWVWMARLVNEPPHLMTGSLLLTLLEVAGFELLRQYKSQFHKLLVLIARDVCPRLSKDAKTGAANAAGQLEILISQYQANGCRLTEPDGRKLEETKLTAADEEKTDHDSGGGYGGGYGGGGGRGYGGGGRSGGRGGGRGGRGGGRGRW